MSEFVKEIRDIYQLFSGDGIMMTVLTIAVCYLMFRTKNRLLRKYFIYPSFIVLILINNPITVKLLVETEFMEPARYVRLYWLIPVSFIIAYACAILVEKMGEKKQKNVVAVFLICMIVVSGSYIFQEGNFEPSLNSYKLPQEVIDVTDRIVEDIEENKEEVKDTRIVVPSELSAYIRQYNGEIKQLYGRRVEYATDLDGSVAEKVKDAMEESVLDCEQIAVNARKEQCRYVVIDNQKAKEGQLEDYGYEHLDTLDTYDIYKDTSEETQWIVTQYGTLTDIQSMSYTLTSTDGKLIVIDGGHEIDAETIRKVAEKYDNVIDLWICTHFHEDHIGAANVILSDPQDIEVKEIWRPYMDQATYDSFAQEWDTVETSHTFFALTEAMPNVKYLKTGDELQFDNLTFKVLSAFDIGRTETYEGNNCGLLFKVMANQDSMLFCADAGVDLSRFLLENYRDELKADYIQMGHHGNGGLSEECYRLVEPKVAFFDAHEELFYDISGNYTTPKNRMIMESMGCEIYRLATAPNRVIMK